jgi:hypothetical protein
VRALLVCFRIVLRRNQLLGVWAAKCLGLWGKAAEDYATSVVDSETVGRGDEAVINKLKVDLWKCAVPISEREIRGQLKAFDAQAQQELHNPSARAE